MSKRRAERLALLVGSSVLPRTMVRQCAELNDREFDALFCTRFDTTASEPEVVSIERRVAQIIEAVSDPKNRLHRLPPAVLRLEIDAVLAAEPDNAEVRAAAGAVIALVTAREQRRAQARVANDQSHEDERILAESYVNVWRKVLALGVTGRTARDTREAQVNAFDAACREAGLPVLERTKQRGLRAKYRKRAEKPAQPS